jgi:hypothetical protein
MQRNIGSELAQRMTNLNEMLAAEAASLRLTDEEREAIEQAIDAADGMAEAERWAVATLRALLERTK